MFTSSLTANVSRLIYGWIAICLLLSLGSPSLIAQENPTPPPPDSTVKVLVAVPISDITTVGEAASNTLRMIQGRVQDNGRIQEIQKNLEEIKVPISELQNRTDSMALESLTLSRLKDFQAKWDRYRARMAGWQKDMGDRTTVMEKDQGSLADLKVIWEKTADLAKEAEAPEVLQERIKGLRDDISKSNKSLRDTLEHILTLGEAVSDQLNLVQQYMAKIDSAENVVRASLFVQERPPIWKEIRLASDSTNLIQEVGGSWNDTLEDVQEFFVSNKKQSYLQLVVLVIFFLLFSSLLSTTKKIDLNKRPSLFFATKVLSQPWASAFLLGIVSGAILFDSAPVLMVDVFLVVVSIPLFVILPRISYPVAWRSQLVIIGLLLFDRLSAVFISDPITRRWILLIESIVALVALIYVIWKGKSTRGGRVYKVFKNLAPFLALLMLISVGANIYGTVSLSYLLSTSTITSVYLALVYYLAVLILEGLVTLAVETSFVRKSRLVANYPHQIKSHSSFFFQWGAIYLWGRGTLKGYGLWDPVVEAAKQVVNFTWTSGTVTVSAGGILEFFLIILISWFFAQFLKTFLEVEVLSRISLPKGVPAAISFVANYTVLVIGFFLAIGATGISLDKFGFLAGALGVGIGFGLQNIVTNFVSGLILIFERPINLGDTVEVGNLKGIVTEIGLRSSKVRTFQGAEVVVPNGEFIAYKVTNWTLSDAQRRLELNVNVAYGSNPREVMDILVKIAKQHPDVLQDPSPAAYFEGFGESSLNFRLLFWVTQNLLGAPSDVALGVHDSLLEAGIQVPFPQRDVNLRWAESNPEKEDKKDKTFPTMLVGPTYTQPGDLPEEPPDMNLDEDGDDDGGDDGGGDDDGK